jgi:alpha-beta hydrolase superfamily lysophospholipase
MWEGDQSTVAIEFIRTISEGKKISGILHLPQNPSPPCVIASHGLFSSKDSEMFVAIGEFFSAQGIAVIRYDHQGCGESEGDLSATTASARIKDLEAIFDLAIHHPLLGDPIGLLGSSMGGFISIFKGAADLRVKALALWATPARLGEKKQGADEEALLKDAFYDDVKKYDAGQAIKNLGNCLILHGEADELVSLSQAKELYQSARAPKHLEVFPGGDHRFTDPQHRRRAIRMSLEWFQKYL